MAETPFVGVALVDGALQALRMSAASEITGSIVFRYFFIFFLIYKVQPFTLEGKLFIITDEYEN
jgi:hypothetical protein